MHEETPTEQIARVRELLATPDPDTSLLLEAARILVDLIETLLPIEREVPV